MNSTSVVQVRTSLGVPWVAVAHSARIEYHYTKKRGRKPNGHAIVQLSEPTSTWVSSRSLNSFGASRSLGAEKGEHQR